MNRVYLNHINYFVASCFVMYGQMLTEASVNIGKQDKEESEGMI